MSAVHRAGLLLRREVRLWERLADLERQMNEVERQLAADPGDVGLRQEALLLMARIANEKPGHHCHRAAWRLRGEMLRLLPELERELGEGA